MSRENSLFNETTIKRLVQNTKLTAKQKKASKDWLKLIEEGKLIKEKQGYLRFYDTILKELLGYDNIKHEKEGVEFSYEKDGKSIVRIEAKGMGTKDLFLPQKRAKEESPVQQLWRYMQLHASPYGIVTNYKIFILFKYDIGSTKYYLFDFEDIKKSPDKLQEFVAIFSRENIDKGFVEDLYEKSIIEEREFTKEFYKLYHETRLMLIKEFEENSDIGREASVHFAQLYLNRLMFVFFAEDTGKISKRIIEERVLKTLDNIHLFSSNSSNISNVLVGLFKDLDKGSDFPIKLFGFNGGLFQHPIPPKIYFRDFRDNKFFKDVNQYSKLKKKDLDLNEKEKEIFEKYKNKLNPIIKNVLLMASFDFNTEVNVNILGHIFEQSISDIEDLKTDKSSRRKKEGIFYTPEYITDYICRNTIIPYLSEKGVNAVPDLIKEYYDNIDDLENKFKEMKILDPACGSGAFLIKATEIMLEIFKAIQSFKQNEGEYEAKRGLKKKSNNKGQLILEKWNEEAEAREIIENSIYGVDINEESVEITKLSLFLKMARKNRKLTDLSDNIKQGNSLIDDEEVAGKLAFEWDKEFPFKFDVVIGNPPYVSQKGTSENPNIDYNEREYYRKTYETLSNNELSTRGGVKLNLFSLWIERGVHLLKDDGFLSLIVHKNLLKVESYKFLRRYILDKTTISEIFDLGAGIFDNVTGETIILRILNKEPKNNKIIIKENINLEQNKFKKRKISQNTFNDTLDNMFNIYQDDSVSNIKSKMQKNSRNMEDCYNIVSFGLNTKDNKKYFLPTQNGSKWKKAIMGRDIARWKVKSFGYVLYDNSVLTRKGDVGSFNAKEKLVLQRIGSGLVAAYDNEKLYCYNSTNMILPKLNDYSIKYVLCLLNSRLINYYYVNVFSMRSSLTVNVTQGYLSQIPIPKLSEKEQKPFIEKADLMLKLNKDFYEKKNKFFNRIKKSFSLEKINKKLDKFYELEFNDFIKEIEKQSKKKISLKEQDEWEDYFNDYKKDILKLESEINKTDNEINKMVYKLYSLTKEEIKVIEEN